MASWTNANTVLTNSGKSLLSVAQAGGGLEITKVVPGAGRVADGSLEAQTAVTTPKAEMRVVSTSSTATGTIINVQLNNVGITTSYDLNQVGIYAKNAGGSEALYLLAQCTSGTADTIPIESDTPIIFNFSFHLIHGSEAVVTATISNAGFVSAEVFNAHRHNNVTPSVDGFMSKEDKLAHNTLVTRINQGVKTTDSPTFASATIGALIIAPDGTITGAKFS